MLKNLPVRRGKQRPAAAEREVNPFHQQEMPETYEEVFRRALSKTTLGRKKLLDQADKREAFSN